MEFFLCFVFQNGTLRNGLPNLLRASQQHHQQHLQGLARLLPAAPPKQQNTEQVPAVMQGSSAGNTAQESMACTDPTLLPFLALSAPAQAGGEKKQQPQQQPQQQQQQQQLETRATAASVAKMPLQGAAEVRDEKCVGRGEK